MAHFAAQHPLLVEATEPHDLTEQMRAAEREFLSTGGYVPLGTTGWHLATVTAAA
jgi:hypothetical protein